MNLNLIKEPSKEERLKSRNKAVREYFDSKLKKEKKWKLEAVIEDTANKFFLSIRTVNAIISFEGIYKK